jgi:hypothetical protein
MPIFQTTNSKKASRLPTLKGHIYEDWKETGYIVRFGLCL